MDVHDLKGVRRIRGFGSVHDVPRLPSGFVDIFDSIEVDIGTARLHAVTGGEGPPLLMLCGWPQCWFAWRYLMQPLAEAFTVIAPDPRGVGLSSKSAEGYDADTLSADMLTLMTILGHDQFAMVGHDVGMWTGYAMAADAPERILRIALGEAFIPGVSTSPPLLIEDRRMSDLLWHFNFNRALDVNERLVEGREAIYFGYQFASKAASADSFPDYARDFYIEQLRRIPGALRASFEFYRAIGVSMPLYRRRTACKLEMPVLAFAGAMSSGTMVEDQLRALACNVTSLVIPDCGHYPAEEKPQILLSALEGFLAPYAELAKS